jgi:hypothetical protein
VQSIQNKRVRDSKAKSEKRPATSDPWAATQGTWNIEKSDNRWCTTAQNLKRNKSNRNITSNQFKLEIFGKSSVGLGAYFENIHRNQEEIYFK